DVLRVTFLDRLPVIVEEAADPVQPAVLTGETQLAVPVRHRVLVIDDRVRQRRAVPTRAEARVDLAIAGDGGGLDLVGDAYAQPAVEAPVGHRNGPPPTVAATEDRPVVVGVIGNLRAGRKRIAEVVVRGVEAVGLEPFVPAERGS